ncbi:MAG: hypothetical protein OEY24_07475 [Candidatus Bathyarchaeota archaeon]|nr:hypothetical protein [Candidatus Bathyarchaeota archaeon]MDH5495520.1 hypothetical protein [Candidatus Bathyarchaeota archaeon]
MAKLKSFLNPEKPDISSVYNESEDFDVELEEDLIIEGELF